MKDRTTGLIHFLKQQWILIWMILAVAGVSMIVTYGVYTEGTYKMKRVVAPAAEIGGLFTSNYLTVGGGTKSVYYQENASSPFTFPLEIRNFNANDPDTKYSGTIDYSISVALAHVNGDEYKDDDPSQITDSSDWKTENMSIMVSLGDTENEMTLTGNTLNASLGSTVKYSLTNNHDRDTWTVTFTNIPLNSDYCVKITATPVNQDLESISQILAVNSVPKIYTEGWSCTLSDNISKGVNNFDAFNYTIVGTGKKTLKFSYDSTKLEINPSFCEYLSEAEPGTYSGSSTEDRTGWKTITIDADPDETKVNRYDLQLYKIHFNPTNNDDVRPFDLTHDENNAGRDASAGIYIEFEEADPTS